MSESKRQELVQTHKRHASDSGSPEVQVAVLTERINEVTNHMRTHVKDYSTRRGLLRMVGKRNRLLKYLSETNREAYQGLIKRLGLRK
ncbi:MAG: 30S ribosomal protein S15 [Phycisphaeraceae bacterium]|nr:MAG: 30S ribosomal protein S15 [Phycisphaeraceae bacterium]